LLDPTSGFCEPRDQPVDRLVVQLGTNPSRDLTGYLKKIIQIACTRQVRHLNFVLPPQDARGAQANTNQKMAAVIESYNPCGATLRTSYFASSFEVSMAPSDFRRDGTHFWNSPSEKTWLNAVVEWSRRGYPNSTLPAPAARTSTVTPTRRHGG
jgi:hypothetical protein